MYNYGGAVVGNQKLLLNFRTVREKKVNQAQRLYRL